MDDHTFDDLIKKKLGNYEDPVFDPSALAAMREHIAGLRPTPWYEQTASRLFVASLLVLFTLINSYVLNTVFQEEPTVHPLPVAAVRQEGHVDSLIQVIARMKCDLEQASYSAAWPQLTHKESASIVVSNTGNSDPFNEVGYKINVGSASKIPVEAYNRLTQLGLLAVENGQGIVILHSQNSIAAEHPEQKESMKFVTLEKPGQTRFILVNRIEGQNQWTAAKNNSGIASLATQKALEKHYFRGIGIDIAPHIDAVKGIFANASGEITPRIGVTADWILSPVLSVETGLDYLTTVAHLDPNSVVFQDHHESPQLGSPQSMSSTYSLGSMPFAIKYRQWITPRNQVMLKLGLTPYATLKKEYQYSYQYNNSPDHDIIQVTTLDRHNDFKYYGSTVTAALGLTSKMKRNQSKFETSLFYERSLGSVGFERLTMQLVGLRTAYWFKLK